MLTDASSVLMMVNKTLARSMVHGWLIVDDG